MIRRENAETGVTLLFQPQLADSFVAVPRLAVDGGRSHDKEFIECRFAKQQMMCGAAKNERFLLVHIFFGIGIVRALAPIMRGARLHPREWTVDQAQSRRRYARFNTNLCRMIEIERDTRVNSRPLDWLAIPLLHVQCGDRLY